MTTNNSQSEGKKGTCQTCRDWQCLGGLSCRHYKPTPSEGWKDILLNDDKKLIPGWTMQDCEYGCVNRAIELMEPVIDKLISEAEQRGYQRGLREKR